MLEKQEQDKDQIGDCKDEAGFSLLVKDHKETNEENCK